MLPGFDDISAELTAHERLLWTGGPEPGIRLRPGDAFQIPFSLLWAGFAFYWEYSVVHRAQGGSGMLMALWGLPFVIVGVYLIIGRFFAEAYTRGRTRYAVTDQRVLIVTNLWTRRVKSIAVRTLGEISLWERKDGSGSITFGPPGPRSEERAAPAFELIKDVRNVYALIRSTQAAAAGQRH